MRLCKEGQSDQPSTQVRREPSPARRETGLSPHHVHQSEADGFEMPNLPDKAGVGL